MSASYYSHAVLGCELPVTKLFMEVTEEHEEHPVPPGAKFCPTCGKPAATKRIVPIFNERDERVGRFNIVWSTDRERAFVGLVSSDGNYRRTGRVQVEDISTLKRQLQHTLQPLGLWDEDKFGLHAVLYCSY